MIRQNIILLATYQLLKNNTDDAMQEFLRARKLLTSHQNLTADDKDKADKLNNRHSWNMGCTLLTYQNFKDGWSFFEYGLRTEAQGAQKWQGLYQNLSAMKSALLEVKT